MLKRLVLSLAAGLALSGTALPGTGLAQAAPPPAQSGTYNLEPVHAMILFSISHFGFSDYYGQVPGATGTLILDAADPTQSHLDVTANLTNLWTPSDKLAEELKSADWLNAARYPAITFRSKAITVTGPTTADVSGDLTLHGVTRPVILKAIFKRAGVWAMTGKYMVGFEATGTIKRSEFGVSNFVKEGLGDEVRLIISAPFEKAL